MFLMADERENDNNARIASRPIQEPMAEVHLDNLIDDTRDMKLPPMELYIGRDFIMPIWEELVKTMKVGELSRFACPYDVRNFHSIIITQYTNLPVLCV